MNKKLVLMQTGPDTYKEYFKIESITCSDYDSSFGGYPWRIRVVITVDAKYWTKLRDKKNLGQLYGIDVGNFIYNNVNKNIPAYNPTVNHDRRAKNGVKTIEMFYYLNDAAKAEALGMTVRKFKNGTFCAKYSEHVNLLSREVA